MEKTDRTLNFYSIGLVLLPQNQINLPPILSAKLKSHKLKCFSESGLRDTLQKDKQTIPLKLILLCLTVCKVPSFQTFFLWLTKILYLSFKIKTPI